LNFVCDLDHVPGCRAEIIGPYFPHSTGPLRLRRGGRFSNSPARSQRHSAPNQPFSAPSIEAKLVEDGIGLVDTVRIRSVMQHRQRLSGTGAAFEFFPVERFGHDFVLCSLSVVADRCRAQPAQWVNLWCDRLGGIQHCAAAGEKTPLWSGAGNAVGMLWVICFSKRVCAAGNDAPNGQPNMPRPPRSAPNPYRREHR